MQESCRTIGEVIDRCIHDETEEWFRQHKGYRSREEALANDVRLVSATVERRRGGYLTVHVGLVTHDRRTTTSNMFMWRLSDSKGYLRVQRAAKAV